MSRDAIQAGEFGRVLTAALGLLTVMLWLAATPVPAAEAKGGFVADIKAQNEHHFKAPLSIRKERKPPTLTRDWEEKLTKTRWEMREGPLSLTVTLKKGGPPDGLLHQQPVVTLSVEGKEVIRSEGSESFPDNPVFVVQIAEMDPSNPYAEVVFSTYTGGAHCCSDTRVLTSSKDGKTWSEIETGPFDGGPLEARDIDGDGRYEFSLRDNAFLYTFGCYACSMAPLLVLQLDGGEISDVSDKPAFRTHHVDSLRNIVEWADEGSDRNGYLAGYVAQKIRLGEGAEAWKLMLKHYDRKSDWGLDWCKVKRDEKGECPKGQTEILPYPQALERFLQESGYELKK